VILRRDVQLRRKGLRVALKYQRLRICGGRLTWSTGDVSMQTAHTPAATSSCWVEISSSGLDMDGRERDTFKYVT